MKNKAVLILALKGYKRNRISKLIQIFFSILLALITVSFFSIFTYEIQVKNKAIKDPENSIVVAYQHGAKTSDYIDSLTYRSFCIGGDYYIKHFFQIDDKKYYLNYSMKDIYSFDLNGQEDIKSYDIMAYDEKICLDYENNVLKNKYNSSLILVGNEPKNDMEILLSSGLVKYLNLSDDIVGKKIKFSFDNKGELYTISGIYNQNFEFYFSYRICFVGTFMICKNNANLLNNKYIDSWANNTIYQVDSFATAKELVKQGDFSGTDILEFDLDYGDTIFILELFNLSYGIVFFVILLFQLALISNKYIKNNLSYLKMLNAFGMKPKQINMIITLQSFFYILKSILISFIFSFTISYILTLLFNYGDGGWVPLATKYTIQIYNYFIVAFIILLVVVIFWVVLTKFLYQMNYKKEVIR